MADENADPAYAYEAYDAADEASDGAYAYAYEDGADAANNGEYYGEYRYAEEAGGYDLQGYDAAADAAAASGGYAYDPASGEWVFAEGDAGAVEGSYFALDAPTNPFGDAAYWQQYGEDAVAAPEEAEAAPVEKDAGGHTDDTAGDGEPGVGAEGGDADGAEETPPMQADSSATTADGSAAASVAATGEGATSSSAQSKRRKNKAAGKTKQERVQMRQAQLEREEAEKQAAVEGTGDDAAATATGKALPAQGAAAMAAAKAKAASRAPTFLERERAKARLRLRKLRAMRRTRMPPQVRILTAPRAHASPLERYFGGPIEAALSDIFWAAIKGDLRRVKFLVEVEQVSVTDAALDPWHMEQTPLHWAAKGGEAAVVEYLLQAGANPRSLDENGSLPLHLACWAGHVDATLALLRATDSKDLYVQDYDAALAPLDWAQLRGHTALVRAIERFEDAAWLPKFVDDLVRGIIRYKIKLYKEPPKSPVSATRGLPFRRVGGAGAATTTQQAPTSNQSQTPEGKPADTTKGTEDPATTPAPESATK